MKILAVDDDPIFLEILSHALSTCGYRDFELLNSPEAASAVIEKNKVKFDCILLDVEMPGMTGVELCKHIRNHPAHQKTPIIMITSLADRRSIDEAFASGASDYITKPLDKIELQARLRTVSRLVEEQGRQSLLEYQLSLANAMAETDFSFDSPISIPDFRRGIEFYALQNYLLTLGIKGIFSVSAVAVSIEDALLAYRLHSRPMFRAMLSDVATVIEDCLKTESLLISYAGCGNFVGILMGRTTWDSSSLSEEMNSKMEDFASIYISDRMTLPKLRVSPVIRNSMFSLTRPVNILQRAIAEAGTVKFEHGVLSKGISRSGYQRART